MFAIDSAYDVNSPYDDCSYNDYRYKEPQASTPGFESFSFDRCPPFQRQLQELAQLPAL
jgi:hypothetical protein